MTSEGYLSIPYLARVDVLDRLHIDVPVLQAGMGGGLAGPELAIAVAQAGGLGTLGLLPAAELRESIGKVREGATGRAVAVNLLMPFLRRSHLDSCLQSRIDVAVVAFGGDQAVVQRLREARVFVFVMVGTRNQVRRAMHWGADGLIAQGCEAGGHLAGDTPASDFLPEALELCDGRPVFLAGGIAAGDDTRRALAAGASGVVAGTRFLLTHESGAHPEYHRRVLNANTTIRTTLFGLGWPAPHRFVANGATERWCLQDGTAKLAPRLINAPSAVVAKIGDVRPELFARWQTSRLPIFSPAAPTRRMPESWVDRAALYAGESALRMTAVIPARQAVAELAGLT